MQIKTSIYIIYVSNEYFNFNTNSDNICPPYVGPWTLTQPCTTSFLCNASDHLNKKGKSYFLAFTSYIQIIILHFKITMPHLSSDLWPVGDLPKLLGLVLPAQNHTSSTLNETLEKVTWLQPASLSLSLSVSPQLRPHASQ